LTRFSLSSIPPSYFPSFSLPPSPPSFPSNYVLFPSFIQLAVAPYIMREVKPLMQGADLISTDEEED